MLLLMAMSVVVLVRLTKMARVLIVIVVGRREEVGGSREKGGEREGGGRQGEGRPKVG